VQLFVDHGVNIELGFHEECGPLIQAIRLGKDDVVQILLKKGAPPNAWASGYSALYEATRKGYISIVRSLMDHGAELDTRQRRDGDVALLGALREGYDEIATILIISGASIHVKSLSGLTALHVAVMSACSRSIDLLIENGLDIDPKDSCGFTPLDYAVTLPAEAIAKQLLDKGAINDHATRFNHLPILDAFPDRVWYSKMVEGYTRMRQLLRNYPHGAQDPKALYGGEKEAGHTHYSQDARPDSPTL
jgi:ankyrin repeat protein